MKLLPFCVLLTLLLTFSACETKNEAIKIVIKNGLEIERSLETIELTTEKLKLDSISNLGVKDMATGKWLVTQYVDTDGDGKMDELLFQTSIGALAEKKFQVSPILESERPESENYCYSRFVPERTDDYTWENDRVAFRMYGPTAQKMVEDKVKGGTLSSGVDAWLKRVDYPIINNWYKKELETDGSYHEDTGEGLDDFHVGSSRGVGGIAIKNGDTYDFSKNYTKWKTITTGPIRTSFFLEIGDWEAAGNQIKESKIISLDYGSNLSKFQVSIDGTNNISPGLTLHEKDGKVTGNDKSGWVSYWQPHADSEIGTGIVASTDIFQGYETYDVEEKDQSNAYAHLRVTENSVIYYAGFAWKKRCKYNNEQEWQDYLTLFAQKINSPLIIEVL